MNLFGITASGGKHLLELEEESPRKKRRTEGSLNLFDVVDEVFVLIFKDFDYLGLLNFDQVSKRAICFTKHSWKVLCQQEGSGFELQSLEREECPEKWQVLIPKALREYILRRRDIFFMEEARKLLQEFQGIMLRFPPLGQYLWKDLTIPCIKGIDDSDSIIPCIRYCPPLLHRWRVNLKSPHQEQFEKEPFQEEGAKSGDFLLQGLYKGAFLMEESLEERRTEAREREVELLLGEAIKKGARKVAELAFEALKDTLPFKVYTFLTDLQDGIAPGFFDEGQIDYFCAPAEDSYREGNRSLLTFLFLTTFMTEQNMERFLEEAVPIHRKHKGILFAAVRNKARLDKWEEATALFSLIEKNDILELIEGDRISNDDYTLFACLNHLMGRHDEANFFWKKVDSMLSCDFPSLLNRTLRDFKREVPEVAWCIMLSKIGNLPEAEALVETALDTIYQNNIGKDKLEGDELLKVALKFFNKAKKARYNVNPTIKHKCGKLWKQHPTKSARLLAKRATYAMKSDGWEVAEDLYQQSIDAYGERVPPKTLRCQVLVKIACRKWDEAWVLYNKIPTLWKFEDSGTFVYSEDIGGRSKLFRLPYAGFMDDERVPSWVLVSEIFKYNSKELDAVFSSLIKRFEDISFSHCQALHLLCNTLLQRDTTNEKLTLLNDLYNRFREHHKRQLPLELMVDAILLKFLLGDIEEGELLCDEVLLRKEELLPLRIHVLAAQIKCRLKKWGEAESHCDKVIAHFGKEKTPITFLMITMEVKLKSGKFKEVELLCKSRHFVEAHEQPSFGRARLMRAFANCKMKNYVTASLYCHIAIADDYHRRSFSPEEWQRAEEIYSDMMSNYEGDIPSDIWVNAAVVKGKLNKWEEADFFYSRALDVSGGDVPGWVRSNALVAKLKLNKPIGFNEAFALFKNPALSDSWRGDVEQALDLDEYGKAVQLFDSAIESHGGNLSYEDWQLGDRIFSRFTQDPNCDKRILEIAALIKVKLGNLKMADDLYQQAIKAYEIQRVMVPPLVNIRASLVKRELALKTFDSGYF